MKKLLAVLLCLGFAGCATFSWTQYFQTQSSGIVGCPTSDIKISGVKAANYRQDNFPLSWQAQCNNKIYYCSQSTERSAVSCTEAK